MEAALLHLENTMLPGRPTLKVAACAVISRIVTLALMILASGLLRTHDAGGVHVFRPTKYPSPSPPGVGGLLAPFTRWDSAWFLSIADSGYPVPSKPPYDLHSHAVDCTKSERAWGGMDYRLKMTDSSGGAGEGRCRDIALEEQAHAFFPLYPLMMRSVSWALSKILSGLGREESLVLGGLLVSNVSFVIAAILLQELGKVITGDSVLAFRGALVFCLSPASVFFSTVYSESLYALLTFAGLLVLFREGRTLKRKDRIQTYSETVEDMCRVRGSRGTLQAWASALFLAAATLTRSNGITAVGVLVLEKVRWMASEANFFGAAQHETTEARTSSSAAARATNYVRSGVNPELFLLHCRLAACAVMSGLQAMVVMAPYFLVQLHAYLKFCGGGVTEAAIEGAVGATAWTPSSSHPWCAWRVPSLYAHVQSTYWSVGLFKYYQWKQIPNFLLAAPVLALTAHGVARFFLAQCVERDRADLRLQAGRAVTSEVMRGQRQRLLPFVLGRTVEVFFGPGLLPQAASEPFERARAAALILQWGFLGVFAALCMNVQVATRFLAASCPPLHWWTATLLFPARSPGTPAHGVLRRSLLWYMTLFFVVGPVLHANFLPWT